MRPGVEDLRASRWICMVAFRASMAPSWQDRRASVRPRARERHRALPLGHPLHEKRTHWISLRDSFMLVAAAGATEIGLGI